MKREKPLEKLELLRSSLVEGMCQSCMRCEVPLIFFLCLCKPQAGVLGLLSRPFVNEDFKKKKLFSLIFIIFFVLKVENLNNNSIKINKLF